MFRGSARMKRSGVLLTRRKSFSWILLEVLTMSWNWWQTRWLVKMEKAV